MARRADAPHDLLFGLLALQNGMVNREQLVAAFGAWTVAGDWPMADLLVRQGALSDPRRAVLEALAAEHLAMHGGAPEKSLASLSTARSVRESLARLGGPDLEATLCHLGSDSTDSDSSEATASYVVGTSTSSGQASASFDHTPGAGSGRCSSHSTLSCTERWRSNRSRKRTWTTA